MLYKKNIMCHMCETEKKKSNAKRSIKWKRWNKRKEKVEEKAHLFSLMLT